ncbi:heparinase II/III family protein [Alterinioella nitratireducens]|uniref:heparinase II/III family protein n=1 Tax=Alterinioella nitratireducens TaxID=2735915 RepID=UPI001554F584|nr:heparinase II/III family protein [Alterinioella nitratireducens]NPD20313.1 heparinase [Alterinioella nitratireducens]
MPETLSPAPISLRERPGRILRSVNRWAAWRAGFSPRARGFTSQPDPRSIGSDTRGRQLMSGNLLFAGVLMQLPEDLPWAIDPPSDAFEDELHGFEWLDHLAAIADGSGRPMAQDWLADWLKRYGSGKGPGWTPDLVGRRQIRWISHALFLMSGQSTAETRAFFAALGRQTAFLARRWRATSHGLPRFEALTGLIYSACALTGMEHHLPAALRALASECAHEIDASGGIVTRNPEELLNVFTLLTWAAAVLQESGKKPDPAVNTAIMRIAPTLRSLRHADGALARFQGGGRGAPGRLDQALSQSGVRPSILKGLAMGYARLSAGRTSIVVDASPPMMGPDALNSHASTLAFEMTSGRRPVIVNCGSGASFGADWRRAGRATPSHSTLSIEGYSSSRLGRRAAHQGVVRQALIDGPQTVEVQEAETGAARAIAFSHDGYRRTHGLVHLRSLSLENDGRLLRGEDGLAALDAQDRDTLDRVIARLPMDGIPYSVRFHLHPDIEAKLDMNGSAVSLTLRGGETWVFRHGQEASLSLEKSVYLESGRLKPRATKQIVLSSRLTDYGSAVSWSLAKPTDTPRGHRDYERDDDWL